MAGRAVVVAGLPTVGPGAGAGLPTVGPGAGAWPGLRAGSAAEADGGGGVFTFVFPPTVFLFASCPLPGSTGSRLLFPLDVEVEVEDEKPPLAAAAACPPGPLEVEVELELGQKGIWLGLKGGFAG